LSYCRFWNSISLFFVLVAKAFPDSRFFSRVTTWESIENFSTDKPDEDDYQIEKAKIAIASGKIYGLGPEKVFRRIFTTILL
jgi:cell division protein FtsW